MIVGEWILVVHAHPPSQSQYLATAVYFYNINLPQNSMKTDRSFLCSNTRMNGDKDHLEPMLPIYQLSWGLKVMCRAGCYHTLVEKYHTLCSLVINTTAPTKEPFFFQTPFPTQIRCSILAVLSQKSRILEAAKPECWELGRHHASCGNRTEFTLVSYSYIDSRRHTTLVYQDSRFVATRQLPNSDRFLRYIICICKLHAYLEYENSAASVGDRY